MSRCVCCDGSFAEDNGWQELCSMECARNYFIGSKKTPKKVSEFEKNLNNPKFIRRIKTDGKKCPPIVAGKMIEVEIESGYGKNKRKFRRLVNIGGAVKVRPMTDKEREQVAKDRGRGGFSDCCSTTARNSAGGAFGNPSWHE